MRPGGGGKVPVNPNYILQRNAKRVLIRNFEGKVLSIRKLLTAHPCSNRRRIFWRRSSCRPLRPASMPPESLKQRKLRIGKITAGLRAVYPEAHCELNFSNELELLIATILSAQCTRQTGEHCYFILFKKYRTAEDYASAPIAELEEAIKTAGFYRNKAKNIQNCCRALVARHGAKSPHHGRADSAGWGRTQNTPTSFSGMPSKSMKAWWWIPMSPGWSTGWA
jgi:adenine-specific DNA glycosylase